MLINHVPGEESRIAVVQDGKLEEYYQERASTEWHVSNIYKGRVTNVEPAIQAAFVDFGLERNGFLHVTDVHPKYFPGKDREAFEKVGSRTARHERPPIQKCFKRGQEVLVQVLKEGIGTKGPTITSYLSIPGRFLVMMPDMTRLGVSRKVEDDDARKEMKDILKALDPPKEFGFIVRTAGIGQTKTDLKRDLSYLLRLWKDIERKTKRTRRVGELYAESDLIIRTIRDVFNNDIDRIVCDDLDAARRAQDFLNVANPRSKSQVVFYDDPVPLFDRFGVERQIEHIGQREVPLPSGGALVIDSTEALVAVDVNSGKSRSARDSETNAYQTNCEAVDEIARQLRLRDLGGLVVLDLIDMRPMKNRKAVETRFRNNLKKDRARTRVGPISQFGLLELTRQRMRPSLKSSIYLECRHCAGRGYSMSPESVVLSVMRRLALVMHRTEVARIELTISPDVAFHILNRKRSELVSLETQHHKPVMVRVGGTTIDHIHVAGFDERGGLVTSEDGSEDLRLNPETATTYRGVDDPSLPEPAEPREPVALDDEDDESEEMTSDRPPARDADAAAGGASAKPAGEVKEEDDDDGEDQPKRRRRRRRGGRGRRRSGDEASDGGASAGDQRDEDGDTETDEAEAASSDEDEQDRGGRGGSGSDGSDDAGEEEDAGPRRRRRRGGRRRRGLKAASASEPFEASGDNSDTDGDDDDEGGSAGDGPEQTEEAEASSVADEPNETIADDGSTEADEDDDVSDAKPAPKKRRRRGRGRKKASARADGDGNDGDGIDDDAAESDGQAATEPGGGKPEEKQPAVTSGGYSNRVVGRPS